MKKFTLLFAMLIGIFSSAWATDVLTLTPSNGTYVTSSGNYVNSITFSTTPSITVTASANNMDKRQTGTYLLWHSGQSASSTYTLSVGDGYLIKSYTVTGEANSQTQTLTAGSVSHEFAVGTSSTFEVTDLSAAYTSFVLTGANASGLKITSISVTVEVDSESAEWKPSIADNAFLTVGEKVSSISAVTEGADNSKWYIVTQVRYGETPMYDAGMGQTMKRAGTSVTVASLNETYANDNAAYLVRFISAGEGLYNMQFANGNWIDANLKTTSIKGDAGTYAFYNSNNGSGSFFGWNKNNNSGSIVDNNGAGYTLSFWGSGTVSGTSGNNVWYVYETTVEVPSLTVDVTYAQYVNGVATGVSTTETVLPNSAINVPSSLYNGYSALAYNFSTEGTIGEEDVTIKVNIDAKAGLITALDQLSNAKAYTLTTERGSLGTNGTQMVSTNGTSYSASNFAIINYEDKYYLYSVADNKFVGNPVTIGSVANQPILTEDLNSVTAISFDATSATISSPLFFMAYGSYGVNVSNYATGIVVNSWTTRDAGNQYCIVEADDFDATAALAALQNYFHPTANMRITDAGWATFWAPFAVEIPAGVKAYTGEMQQGWIRMNEQTKGYIPANTGVVLELVEGEPFETELSPMSPQPNEAAVESCYTGNESGAIMNVEDGDYLLQKNFDDEKKEDVVGWYKVSGEGFTLAPNRCYLSKDDVPAPNQSRTFFGFAPDDATGINSIATEAKTKADGKYMVNGQIVVVKAGKAYNMSGAEIK